MKEKEERRRERKSSRPPKGRTSIPSPFHENGIVCGYCRGFGSGDQEWPMWLRPYIVGMSIKKMGRSLRIRVRGELYCI